MSTKTSQKVRKRSDLGVGKGKTEKNMFGSSAVTTCHLRALRTNATISNGMS